MPLQLLKLQKVSFSSIFADATFFPVPDWFITEQKGDSGISEVVGVRLFSQYIIDVVFLLLEHLSCIMHIKFMESIIVYQPYKYESISASTWTYCMWNI